MSRTIINVAGEVNYSQTTGHSNKVDLDSRKAVIYIVPNGIKYGIIVNAYRKNDDVIYDQAELINSASNPITISYADGYANIKGKIQLKNSGIEVGELLDFSKTFAVENDVSSKDIVIDSQNSFITGLGASYDKITIYANVHF